MIKVDLNIRLDRHCMTRHVEIYRVGDSTKRRRQTPDSIGTRSVAAQQVRQPSADETAIFDALRATGGDESLAFEATQSVRAIAGENVTAMVGALREELRSFKEEVGARLRAQPEELLARLDQMQRVRASRFESVESNLVTINWAIGPLILIHRAARVRREPFRAWRPPWLCCPG